VNDVVMHEKIQQATLRAERDPSRLGHAIAAYRTRQGWTRQQAADWLAEGDTVATDLIGSERLPLRAEAFYIAEQYGMNPDRLALVVTQANVRDMQTARSVGDAVDDMNAQREGHKEQAVERMRAAIKDAVIDAVISTHEGLKSEADQWRGRPGLQAQRVLAAMSEAARIFEFLGIGATSKMFRSEEDAAAQGSPDELVEQANAAEPNGGLMGSALAAFCASKGWTRADLAAWIETSEANIAALYCEPRPVPTITRGNVGAMGLVPITGHLIAMADTFGADPENLIEAFEEGRDLFEQRAPS
jgi:hypothetical protein